MKPGIVLRSLAGVFACVAALVLLASFVLDSGSLEAGILSRLPACPARLAGSSCALCGMTHGIVAISHGRIREGARWNRGAPWLYAGMVVIAGTGLAATCRAGRAATAAGRRRRRTRE